MQIELCGRAAVVGPGGRRIPIGRPQVQLALAALVLERHRPMSFEELAHILWGDDRSPHWRGAARGVLAKVRAGIAAAGFADASVQTSNGFVSLARPGDVTVDVEVARRESRVADELLRGSEARAAIPHARRSVDVLARGFLVAVDAPWADDRRFELAESSRHAGRLLARACLEAGDATEAMPVIRRLAEEDPFDDDVHILWLRALAAAGDRREVRRAHERYVATLDQELGVAPSARVVETAAELGASGPAGTDPPKGARPRVAGADRGEAPTPFVGRDRELAALVAAAVGATDAGSVVVHGEPGVGKTRLATELARAATDAGCRVLWGRCDPEGQLPYQPVSEAISGVLTDPGTDGELHDLLAELGPLDMERGVPDTGSGRGAGAGEGGPSRWPSPARWPGSVPLRSCG